MSRHSLHYRALPVAVIALTLIASASLLRADESGRTGKAQSATGCNCHGTLNSPGVTLSITGPHAVLPSSTNSYTATVSGGPVSTTGGFNLKATGGTLVAGPGSTLSSTELTHSSSASRSWTFNWTAPSTTGTQNFFAIGLAADASSDEGGDQWNWYGGALNTPFAITVTNQLAVEGEAATTWLAPAMPNPLVSQTQLTFSLAKAGWAKLEAFDAAGRRVATLTNGSLPAGRRTIAWHGTNDAGAPLQGGIYLVRLRTMDRSLTTTVLVLR